jgi:hypothetical protein
MERPNLGLTVNGLPLDDGAGLWAPPHMFPGATSRDARVTARWGNVRDTTAASGVKITHQRLRKNGRFVAKGTVLPGPTKEEMLARLRAGKG